MDDRRQLLAFDERHGQELDAVDLAELVNPDDVLVSDLAGQEQLLLEAPLEHRRGLGVGSDLRPDHLQRDQYAQLRVPRLVDRAHAAEAKQLHDVIARAERRAGCERSTGTVGRLDDDTFRHPEARSIEAGWRFIRPARAGFVFGTSHVCRQVAIDDASVVRIADDRGVGIDRNTAQRARYGDRGRSRDRRGDRGCSGNCRMNGFLGRLQAVPGGLLRAEARIGLGFGKGTADHCLRRPLGDVRGACRGRAGWREQRSLADEGRAFPVIGAHGSTGRATSVDRRCGRAAVGTLRHEGRAVRLGLIIAPIGGLPKRKPLSFHEFQVRLIVPCSIYYTLHISR